MYAKRPFDGPEQVLRYLSLYTHRIALSDKRIEQMDAAGDRVQINYKDYRDSGKRKRMWLTLGCFLARYCSYILPRGFVKIRHYGILANRGVTERLANLREQIELTQQEDLNASITELLQPEEDSAVETTRGNSLELCCPRCGGEAYQVVKLSAEAIAACIEKLLPSEPVMAAGASP